MLDRWWARAVLVLVVYVVAVAFADPGGSLGTDSGAKVATLQAMTDHGSLRPDIGYWAEDLDPDGIYHPYLDTRANDRDEWVGVTSLPMLVLSQPVAAVAGQRAALIWPMLGALLAAFAAADIAKRLGGGHASRRAFWVVAVASPVTIYALDFWEHAPGTGLMVAGTAVMLRVTGSDRRWWMPLLAGVLFGAAGAMRSEAYIVGAVAVGLACLSLLRTDRLAALRAGVTALAGFAAVFLSNAMLETTLGGNSRASRASGQAGRDPFDRLGQRLSDSAMTWFGGPTGSVAAAIALGAVFACLVVCAVVLIRRGDDRRARIAMVGAGGVMAVVLLGGPGFVPGALIASPVVLATPGLARLDRERGYVLTVALVSTVLVWAYQILDAAGPQWGGRYLLAPTILLTALGAVALDDLPAWFRRSVIGLALVVTMFGVVWLSVRTHDVSRFFDALGSRPEPVLIASDGFLIREGGAAGLDEQWLSLGRGEPFIGALDIAEAAGVDRIGLVSPVAEPPERPGWTAIATTELELLDGPYYVHTFRLAATP